MAYGFIFDSHWDPTRHTVEDKKTWDKFDQIYRASDQMNWFLKQV